MFLEISCYFLKQIALLLIYQCKYEYFSYLSVTIVFSPYQNIFLLSECNIALEYSHVFSLTAALFSPSSATIFSHLSSLNNLSLLQGADDPEISQRNFLFYVMELNPSLPLLQYDLLGLKSHSRIIS
jgi:hypothetical protein